jgi:hypothetical protein
LAACLLGTYPHLLIQTLETNYASATRAGGNRRFSLAVAGLLLDLVLFDEYWLSLTVFTHKIDASRTLSMSHLEV